MLIITLGVFALGAGRGILALADRSAFLSLNCAHTQTNTYADAEKKAGATSTCLPQAEAKCCFPAVVILPLACNPLLWICQVTVPDGLVCLCPLWDVNIYTLDAYWSAWAERDLQYPARNSWLKQRCASFVPGFSGHCHCSTGCKELGEQQAWLQGSYVDCCYSTWWRLLNGCGSKLNH